MAYSYINNLQYSIITSSYHFFLSLIHYFFMAMTTKLSYDHPNIYQVNVWYQVNVVYVYPTEI
jgi:hypothetical protein